jgi:hypothetical protein
MSATSQSINQDINQSINQEPKQSIRVATFNVSMDATN